MDGTIEEIEARRLDALLHQAALYGPQTEPSILIEIAELKHKKRGVSETRKAYVNNLDYDFLMDVVSATLVRFNQIETALSDDQKKRYLRQLLHDIWMITITVIVFLTLLLQLLK